MGLESFHPGFLPQSKALNEDTYSMPSFRVDCDRLAQESTMKTQLGVSKENERTDFLGAASGKGH